MNQLFVLHALKQKMIALGAWKTVEIIQKEIEAIVNSLKGAE